MSGALFLIAACAAYRESAYLLGLFDLVVPYSPAIAFVCLGAFGVLYKDWEKYDHPIAAQVALALLFIFGAFMGINTFRERENRTAEKEANTKTFKEIKTSVGDVSQSLNEFKSTVNPEELKLKMSGLSDTMQKILNPPKATLAFSFIPFFNPPLGDPRKGSALKEISRAMDDKRTVTFDITAINTTPEVTASAIDLRLIICDDCLFAKEPKGFTKLQGDPEHVRYMKVGLMNGRTTIPDVTLDITVPPRNTAFLVGFDYRCAACILTKQADLGIVKITNAR